MSSTKFPVTLVTTTEFYRALDMAVALSQLTPKMFDMQRLTCINHQDLLWLTKDLRDRNLHYTSIAQRECDCPLSDLRVMVRGA